MYGQGAQASNMMADANERRDAARRPQRPGNRFGQIRNALAGANDMRNNWRQANPGAVPQQPGIPAGKTMPDFSAIRNALGGSLGAVQPPGPETMPPPGGNNFYSQRLAQTGMDPSRMPQPMIRRSMPDFGRPMAGQIPQGPVASTDMGGDPRAAAIQRMQAFRGFRG